MLSNLINEMDYLGKCKLSKCTKKGAENLSGPINIKNLNTNERNKAKMFLFTLPPNILLMENFKYIYIKLKRIVWKHPYTHYLDSSFNTFYI